MKNKKYYKILLINFLNFLGQAVYTVPVDIITLNLYSLTFYAKLRWYAMNQIAKKHRDDYVPLTREEKYYRIKELFGEALANKKFPEFSGR